MIVPAYNAGKTIERCLASLVEQNINRSDYEVIVVDDGSTDSTSDLIKKFDVTYIYQKNKGPAAARNHGAKTAKGKIILFTDSDCVPQNNWIEEMTKPFSDPSVIAVKGAYRTNQKSMTARFSQLEFEERFDMLKKAESIDMIDTYSAAFRKDIFWSVNGFDEFFPVANNEDTELSYKLSGMGYKMVFNPKAVVCHLNHPDSIKRYARLKFWRGYWRMVVYRRYPNKMFRDSYTPQTLKLQILFLFIFLTCLPFSWFMPNLLFYPAILCLILFILSTLPFIRLALTRDLIVALLSPFFLSVRAVSLGTGTLWAILSQKILK